MCNICAHNMCSQHVLQHVLTTCAYNMCLQHVFTTCAYNMCLQHVLTTCVYNMCLQHVQHMCSQHVQHVLTTCARRNKACFFSVLYDLKLGLSPEIPNQIDWNLQIQNTTSWCIEDCFNPSPLHPSIHTPGLSRGAQGPQTAGGWRVVSPKAVLLWPNGTHRSSRGPPHCWRQGP